MASALRRGFAEPEATDIPWRLSPEEHKRQWRRLRVAEVLFAAFVSFAIEFEPGGEPSAFTGTTAIAIGIGTALALHFAIWFSARYVQRRARWFAVLRVRDSFRFTLMFPFWPLILVFGSGLVLAILVAFKMRELHQTEQLDFVLGYIVVAGLMVARLLWERAHPLHVEQMSDAERDTLIDRPRDGWHQGYLTPMPMRFRLLYVACMAPFVLVGLGWLIYDGLTRELQRYGTTRPLHLATVVLLVAFLAFFILQAARILTIGRWSWMIDPRMHWPPLPVEQTPQQR